MAQSSVYWPPSTNWPASNFVLAAGTATFQPSTRKVLIIYDTSRTRPGTPRESYCWFLPRGRKDVGESIEACAMRETLEETGYVATLLPTLHDTRQPAGAAAASESHTEAFHLELLPGSARRSLRLPEARAHLYMYVALWFVCTIPADAARVADYGAHFVGAHELGYDSELVEVCEAVRLLSGGKLEYREEGEGVVVERATGERVSWDNAVPDWVQPLIVARGWEIVKRTVEGCWVDGDVEEAVPGAGAGAGTGEV